MNAAVVGACPTVDGNFGDGAVVLNGRDSGTAGSGTAPRGEVIAPEPTTPPCDPTKHICRDEYEVTTPDDKPAAARAVTIRDLAAFRPAEPAQRMEPDGWAVVGLPANFIARAGSQTLRGELLGRSAEVRFTPIQYRWRYGDGRERSTSVPGATWSALRVDEFQSTPTSHVYARRGRVTVGLDVTYTAEYRVGGGAFRAVEGVLVLSAPERAVVVSSADTVLVAEDCRDNPRGPGC